MAFNAKNLTYNKSEPAFLQRLKAGFAAQDGRTNIQQARSGKSRLKMGDGEDDDGPVIVDDAGEIIDQDVYDNMVQSRTNEDKPQSEIGEEVAGDRSSDGPAVAGKQSAEPQKQKMADIGVTKKRKVVKMIDAGEETGGVDHQEHSNDPRKTHHPDRGTAPKKDIGKPKKKAKKIKLSFDDPE